MPSCECGQYFVSDAAGFSVDGSRRHSLLLTCAAIAPRPSNQPFKAYFLTVSALSRLLLKQGVLASPWWQRVLLVAPICLLLWLGVFWALGGD
jgi:hypothetical protein